ncbi:MAG: flagellar hook protein FlgE [Candidatus Obscuribacterales bacterium]|nr:flagellar hook protein FlgE [Steroidobacteraceae bacterium]
MSFTLALSGLNAASTDLNATANNIANTSTTGFKSSRTEFAELFAVSPQGTSNTQTGNGVRVSGVSQQFAQGSIEVTGNSLDMALSGEGFFIMNDAGGLTYSRAGAFQLDNSGYVVNNQNERLQVYPVLPSGGFNTGGLGDLRLVTSVSAPAATQSAQVLFNLPASASPPTVAPLNPANANSYNEATSLTVYDSLGAAHTATTYFVKTATANQWEANLYIDGTAVGAAQTLQYSSSGTLTVPVGGLLTFPAYTPTTGAAPLNLSFDVAPTTQYGNSFSINAVTQDGYTTGRLIGIDFDSTGVVQARFTNGRSIALGQVALANFANPQGMQKLDNTSWAETFSSGQPLRGQAGTAGLGLIQSGALESSNVDLTEQLVNMITAQRNFQANAQVISTSDQVTQTIINIR